jgi:hypothetical protein
MTLKIQNGHPGEFWKITLKFRVRFDLGPLRVYLAKKVGGHVPPQPPQELHPWYSIRNGKKCAKFLRYFLFAPNIYLAKYTRKGPKSKRTRNFRVIFQNSKILDLILRIVDLYAWFFSKFWISFWKSWTFMWEFFQIMDVIVKIVDLYVWFSQNSGPHFENRGPLCVNF